MSVNSFNRLKYSIVLIFMLVFSFIYGGSAYCQEAKKITIGVSLPTQREERWVRDARQIEQEAKKRGIEIKMQISDNDAMKQIAQCENLIAGGVEILILAPHDATGAAPIVENAHSAGIKVISYDRLVMNADCDLYVSFDNEKVGEIQGEFITKTAPKGNYIILSGSPTDNNAAMYKAGAMKFIKPLSDKGDIKIVMEQSVKDWQPSEAMKIVENALTANDNKIDAVLAPNDGTAGGAIQALAAQDMDGKVVVTGQDAELSAAQRIVAGTQSMTVFKDTRKQAIAAVDAAEKILSSKEVEITKKINNNKGDIPSLLLTPIAVDKSNIDSVIIDSGYLTKEEVYKK
jgi:D-xylose transport system substrate-binding protein